MGSIERISEETPRPQIYANRHSIWGDTFSSSFVWNNQVAEKYAKEIEPLKEEVRAKLLAETNNELEKLHLIDILERLGIFYHYEKEIDENLEYIFSLITGSEEKNQYDLYDAALLFRICRQHGYDISSDIFKKFKDSNGTFKEELSNDPEGLLSLYEASFLRRHGDDILEDALSFTKFHLQNMGSQMSSALKKQVEHALVLPFHRSQERTEAYYNITFYEDDESRDEKLLKFAKLDYNLLQMLHKQELSDVMKWWKPIIETLDYARDRMVECHYIAIGQYFEPQYSSDRIMATKGLCLISVIDDTYDSYGTIEELKLFTNAIERWSYDETDRLPDKIKLVYEIILNFYQEYEEELRKQGRSFALDNWKYRLQELVKAYHEEAIWILGGCIPSFEEYIKNACITISHYQVMTLFLLSSKYATEDTFEWLKTNPKLVVSCARVDRLIDDISTYEDDKVRGQLTNGIECYMKQYEVSKKEAFVKFHQMLENAWKDINGEVSKSSQISMFVFRMSLNYVRTFHIFFNNDTNHYSHVQHILKFYITRVLVNPINI